MKKIFLLALTVISIFACSPYDHSEILNQLKDHENRINALEQLCRELNSNVQAIQTALTAIEQGDHVTEVMKIMENGVEVGYSITFAKSGTISIYHGADGAAGSTPQIGIKKASDGGYYWTTGDDWLTDDHGNKIPATVTDPDATYITPQFRIADGVWHISYDNGNSWRQIDAFNNEPLLQSVYSDNDYLYLILNDGTEFKIRTKQPLSPTSRFGVRWNLNDPNNLGERIFDAIGLSAEIGIGPINGHSDFDNIYPWSQIRRCNIQTNSNGAAVITYEGQPGFALDGSNGDVFVRIPKFCYERYVDENDYEYRIISQVGSSPHPAFVEDGRVLDEIFISAFEGCVMGSKMRSYADSKPSMNMTLEQFLASAQANGINYSLYDSRCVDLLFTLMAVEYGCRNSNRVIGYGLANYFQPIYNTKTGFVSISSAESTNTIRTNYFSGGLRYIHAGEQICVCANQNQRDILTHATLLSIDIPEDKSYIDFTFDGPAINIDTDCFLGSAPQKTNLCESCSAPLTWHTGRSNITYSNDTRKAETINPCRYRWIENPVGNAWHMLPDVTFNSLQMYVCKDMRHYSSHSHVYPYEPIGDVIVGNNNDNGHKDDLSGYNYWITRLGQFDFAKGISFGVEYDKSLVSTQAFGAYHYLNSGTVSIVNGGGFDHLWRCNILTNRAWNTKTGKWYLYGARLMYKNIGDR